MNKKNIIIALGILAVLIIALITWLYIQNSRAISQSASVTTSDTAIVTTTTDTTLPTVTQPKAAVSNTSEIKQPQAEIVMVDNFKWLRVIFFNENNISKRLLNYFVRTDLDQKLILDKCDLVREEYCLADFKAILKTCNLSGDELSHVPLVYNRSTKTCYQGYTEIISYLNDEVAANERNK